MEPPVILDSEITTNKELINSLKWWESKRIVFNIAVIFTQIYVMSQFPKTLERFGFPQAFIGSFGHLLVANMLFNIGWGLEILAKYYGFEKTFRLIISFRGISLFLGLLFSVILTYSIYSITLYKIENPLLFL